MLLLINHYKIYLQNGILTVPPNVLKWTNTYKANVDIFLSYINERTEESKTHIHMNELYKDFTIWFRTQNPQEKIPAQRIFTQNIGRHKDICNIKINEKSNSGIRYLKIS